MAVAAVEPQLLHVNGMREGHRLGGLIPDPGVLGREIVTQTSSHHSSNEQKAKYDLARQPVGPSRKDVRHPTKRGSLIASERPGKRFSEFFHKRLLDYHFEYSFFAGFQR